ncbi:MAG: hypothetical protein JNL32_07430 [Candidatus Kapabacteria bacterium]|nr:hypothetical protein [Candidatus Kapabacteria bacterium]
MNQVAVEILGYVAACCSTFAMLPQALHIHRTGEVEQLSLRAFSMASAGAVLWLAYGLLIGNMVVILANVVAVFIVGYIFLQKLRSVIKKRG